MVKKGMSNSEKDELLRTKTNTTEREDLDDYDFDLEKYGVEFDLNEELKSPILGDEEFEMKTKKPVTKKKTVKKGVKNQAKKKTKKKEKKETEVIITAKITDEDIDIDKNTDNLPKKEKASSKDETSTKEKSKKDDSKEQVEEDPREVKEYEPKYYSPKEEESGWWIAVLIILILAASGVMYKYSQTQTPVSSAECTSSFLKTEGVTALNVDTLTGVKRTWLANALTSENEKYAHNIFTMLACNDETLSLDSEPSKATCKNKKQDIDIVITEKAIKNQGGTLKLLSCSKDKTSGVQKCDDYYINLDTNKLNKKSKKVSVLTIIRDNKKKSVVSTDLNEPALTIFETNSGYLALLGDVKDQNLLVARLFSGDPTLKNLKLRYVTEKPRLVTWSIE